jgi:hypothetical protein
MRIPAVLGATMERPHVTARGRLWRDAWGGVRYEFLVPVRLSETARAAFPELNTATGPTGGGTALWGPVEDEADLADFLARFANLGLTVVEMRVLPD